jgi:hypothetical protein
VSSQIILEASIKAETALEEVEGRKGGTEVETGAVKGVSYEMIQPGRWVSGRWRRGRGMEGEEGRGGGRCEEGQRGWRREREERSKGGGWERGEGGEEQGGRE